MLICNGFDIRKGRTKLGIFQADKEKINAVRFTWCFYIENIVFVIDVESVFFQTFFAFAVGNDPEIFLIFFGKPHNQVGTDSTGSENADGGGSLFHEFCSSRLCDQSEVVSSGTSQSQNRFPDKIVHSCKYDLQFCLKICLALNSYHDITGSCTCQLSD